MKNRENAQIVLPPQIKANLEKEQNPDAHLLKENANRYTWEGRLHDMQMIKKIPKEITDKNYKMTFADFKKMQKGL